MAISDLLWVGGLAVWALTVAASIALPLVGRRPHLEAARMMLWLSPVGPFAAALLWICIGSPENMDLVAVSSAVSTLIGITMIEGLSRIDARERIPRH